MMVTHLVRSLLAFAGLLLFVLWLPIAAVTYLPGWHAASCEWNPRCHGYDAGRAPDDGTAQRIVELRRFMQHRADLPDLAWTLKEQTHLREVRGLLDRLPLPALLGLLVFLHAESRTRALVAGAAAVGIAACALVLPFFGEFWHDVFHPLLFSNNLWINTPADTSWWVMPRTYFAYTTALVIGSAVALCLLARWQARRSVR